MIIEFCSSFLEQTFLFFPLALSMYFNYLVLNIPDLSIQGSYVLGAAIFAKGIRSGCPMSLALFLGLLGGAISGALVGKMQYRGKIHPLIAGILALYILNSITLRIMGTPHLSLLYQKTPLYTVMQWFSHGNDSWVYFLLLAGLSGLLAIALIALLRSPLGLLFRGYGDNPLFLHRLGVNTELIRSAGLMMGGVLAALSGILFAEKQGGSEITMGEGQVLTALACVLIGKQLYGCFYIDKNALLSQVACCFIGTAVYYFFLHFFIALGINPIDLRMLIGLGLIVFLLCSRQRELFSSEFEY